MCVCVCVCVCVCDVHMCIPYAYWYQARTSRHWPEHMSNTRQCTYITFSLPRRFAAYFMHVSLSIIVPVPYYAHSALSHAYWEVSGPIPTGITSLLARPTHSAIIYPIPPSTLLAPPLNATLCSALHVIERPGHGTSGAGTAASGRVGPAGGGGAARGRGAAAGCVEAPRGEHGEAAGGKATEGPRETSGYGVLEGPQGQRATEKAVQ